MSSSVGLLDSKGEIDNGRDRDGDGDMRCGHSQVKKAAMGWKQLKEEGLA